MPKRRYTTQQKLTVVADAEVNGVVQAAEAHGINESTIRYWMNDPDFAEIRAKTREELGVGFLALSHLAQNRLANRIDEMEPRDLTILLGVATDKHLLMSGAVTSRSEVNTFHGHNDHEKRAIAELLRRAVADATESDAAGDVEGAAVVGVGTSGADSPAG